MAISDIPVDQSNSLLPPCLLGESDSSETDPAVVFLASCPMDLAVGQNVDAGSELVVVLGEDQPLVGGAIAGKLAQETPTAALDQAADNAKTTSKVDVRMAVIASVPLPTTAKRQTRSGRTALTSRSSISKGRVW